MIKAALQFWGAVALGTALALVVSAWLGGWAGLAFHVLLRSLALIDVLLILGTLVQRMRRKAQEPPWTRRVLVVLVPQLPLSALAGFLLLWTSLPYRPQIPPTPPVVLLVLAFVPPIGSLIAGAISSHVAKRDRAPLSVSPSSR